MMRRISDSKFLMIVIALVFVVQISSSAYILLEIDDLRSSISEVEILMNTNFNSVNQNIDLINSDVRDLSSSLSSTQETLSQTQSDLESQINSLKAEASSDFSGIIEESVEAVVSIRTDAAQGTGFVVTSDGYVVTNAHVLEGASYANAITADQNIKPMTLIGYSSTLDLALLKISGNYDELRFGDSSDVKVGEKVIAIGNPFGLSFSVSEGIVSAVHREVSSFDGEYIQTDAALNSGNSGGPLIDTDGNVVGVNNFKVEGDNIGFALESRYVIEEINKIALERVGYEII